MTVYEYDRMLLDVLLSRSMGVERRDLDGWIDERRRGHYGMLPSPGVGEALLRRAGAAVSPYGSTGTVGGRRPRRALDAIEASPHERTLDVLGIDYYDPQASRHFRLPGHRTAGGRNPLPVRELWDDPPDPAGLTRWLGRPGRPHPRPAPVGGGERALQPVAQRPLARPARRLGPPPLPAGQRGRRGGRRRRRRAGRGLLALVAGRQLRVGVLRAPLRHPRGGPRPRRARAARGSRPTPWAGTPPAPTARSSPGLRAGDRSVLRQG